MEKEFISEKITYYRKLRGITQEGLAEKTGLSVRTISRIESAEVDARLYTIKTIADALAISMDVFNPPPSKDERGQLMIVHLCSLFGLLFPLGNIITPLIYWLSKKDQLNNMDKHGKMVLNAQISYTILTFFTPAVLFLVMSIWNTNLLGRIFTLGPLHYSIFIIFSLLIPAIKSFRLYKGKEIKGYPFSFKLIK